MTETITRSCQICFRPVAQGGAGAGIEDVIGKGGIAQSNQAPGQIQWFSHCRCNSPYRPNAEFAIEVCANCKKRVAPYASFPVSRRDICSCQTPKPYKIPSQIKPGAFDEYILDIASVRLPAEYFPGEKYTPLAFLGDSVRALVLLCRDKQSGSRVAVKLFKGISPALYPSFESEVRKNRQLSHTNIARILDSGIYNGKTPYIVTVYKEGFNLEQCVSLYGSPSYDVAISIILSVCETLNYSMKQGVLHRDLRPGNIIFLDDMNAEPSVCLSDYAMPKVKASEELKDPWQSLYLSADEARGLEYGEKSEMYCLGSIGYFLLTGQAPFTDGSALEIKNMHGIKLPPRISSVKFSSERPGELDEIIERCLEKNPKDRFESILKFQERLEAFPRRLQLKVAEAQAARKRAKLLRTAAMLGAATAAVAAICAGLFLAFGQH